MVKQRTKTFKCQCLYELECILHVLLKKEVLRKIFLKASLRGVVISEVLPTASCCIFSARFAE